MMTFDLPQFFATFGTFLVALLVLRQFLYKPLIAMIEERQANLHDDLQSAKKNKEDMEKLKIEHDRHLREAEKKIQEMMRQATQSAEQARGEIMDGARQEAKTLSEKTQQQLIEEREKMMKSLREEVITLSIQVAERVVKRNMDKEAQAELAKRFVKELAK